MVSYSTLASAVICENDAWPRMTLFASEIAMQRIFGGSTPGLVWRCHSSLASVIIIKEINRKKKCR